MTLPRLAGWAATAAVAAALAPPLEPVAELGPRAIPLGIITGVVLFSALARKRIPARAVASLPPGRLAARALVLTVRAAQEEAIWRALVLGLLAGPLGRLAALGASTVAFAASHVRRQGRDAARHLATGAVFGSTYVVTGQLGAAIAAHAAYNVLIGAGLLSLSDRSAGATSGVAGTTVRSRGASPRPQLRDARPLPVPSSVASLDAVTKSFGAVRALDGVRLDLRPGEVLGLLGPNGAGKSTVISLLLGLRRPDTGRALLFGRDPRETAARRRIGVVLQETSLPPVARVGELVDLVRAHFPDPVPQHELLARFHLDEAARTQVGALSGGQRRRLVVALAVAGRPEALFLDEPTAAIDATGRRALWRELSAFVGEGGAVLLTTQQLEEAEQHATRLVLIARGRVVGEGTVDEVRARAGKARISLRADRLPSIPAVTSVESTLDRHVVYVDDPDAFVAELVRSGISYRDLEVTRPRLEDAFVALTEEGA